MFNKDLNINIINTLCYIYMLYQKIFDFDDIYERKPSSNILSFQYINTIAYMRMNIKIIQI